MRTANGGKRVSGESLSIFSFVSRSEGTVQTTFKTHKRRLFFPHNPFYLCTLSLPKL